VKLLIVTQKVDRTDPILGFFRRWIEEFAKHCEHLTVIGQYVAERDFGPNVTVVSLRKEDGGARAVQVLRFWRRQWSLRKQYDRVLVHMTPVWILLGAPLWLLLHKRMYLWYEIKRGSWKLSLALLFVRKVFTGTQRGIPRAHRKQVVVGHAVDTEKFSPDPRKCKSGLIVSIGRITRSKHFDVVLRAFAQLPDSCRLFIAGGTITAKDRTELASLRALMAKLRIAERVSIAWVPPDKIPALLQRADLFLHACIGGLDKVVLESMACGCPIVTSSALAEGILPPICLVTEESMAHHARELLALSTEDRSALVRDLRSRVERNHSLPHLIRRMVSAME